MSNLPTSNQLPNYPCKSPHPNRAVVALHPSNTKEVFMNTSAFKKTVMCIMFVFAVQLAVVPAQTLYAGCAASAMAEAVSLDAWFMESVSGRENSGLS